MLERYKRAAREKLQRAVAEVVSEHVGQVSAEQAHSRQQQQDLQAEVLAALDQLSQSVSALADRVHLVEVRARRDLHFSADNRAVQEAAAFVLEHMPKAPVFWHPHEILRFALSEIKGPGAALEFGVATGTTLQIIADTVCGDRSVVGFDVFTGLPETWRTFFPQGEFAQEEVPTVQGAEIIVGLFEDQLPAFLARNEEQVAFLHVDCDLYSSTKTVLDLLADRLAPEAVLLFDEFFNYPGWQQHEFRAWSEFVEATGRSFEYLGYSGNNEQVAIRLH